MADDLRPLDPTRAPARPERRWRLQFRLVGVARRTLEQFIDTDGLPRRSEDERERGDRFRGFATLLRGVKCSVRVIRDDGVEVYVPPKVCCTAAAVLGYLAALERGSCLAWMEWGRLADLRGVEYNSAYKQILAFSRIMRRECGIDEPPFEYPERQRGAVRFAVAPFDVEFCA